MNATESKRIVLGSVAVAGGITAIHDLSAGKAPRLRIFIGAMVAGAVLAMAAELAPAPAATFAILLATTAVFTAGFQTWQSVARLFS